MSDGDVPDTEQNYQLCLAFCGKCPTMPDDEDEEVLYCARGPSDHDIDRQGCKCKECPLWMQCGLESEYYCDSN